MYDGDDSKTEFEIPIFFINSLNECLSLTTSGAEDFMYEIQEEMCFRRNFEYPLFQLDSVNTEKKKLDIISYIVSF